MYTADGAASLQEDAEVSVDKDSLVQELESECSYFLEEHSDEQEMVDMEESPAQRVEEMVARVTELKKNARMSDKHSREEVSAALSSSGRSSSSRFECTFLLAWRTVPMAPQRSLLFQASGCREMFSHGGGGDQG